MAFVLFTAGLYVMVSKLPCISVMFCARFLQAGFFTEAVTDRFWRYGLTIDLGARNGQVLISPVILILLLLLFYCLQNRKSRYDEIQMHWDLARRLHTELSRDPGYFKWVGIAVNSASSA